MSTENVEELEQTIHNLHVMESRVKGFGEPLAIQDGINLIKSQAATIKELKAENEDYKRQQKTLMKHIGKMFKNNEETVSILLDVKSENLIKLLEIMRNSVYQDLNKLNDGEYMSRNSLLENLDEVIELLKEALNPTEEKEDKKNE